MKLFMTNIRWPYLQAGKTKPIFDVFWKLTDITIIGPKLQYNYFKLCPFQPVSARIWYWV